MIRLGQFIEYGYNAAKLNRSKRKLSLLLIAMDQAAIPRASAGVAGSNRGRGAVWISEGFPAEIDSSFIFFAHAGAKLGDHHAGTMLLSTASLKCDASVLCGKQGDYLLWNRHGENRQDNRKMAGGGLPGSQRTGPADADCGEGGGRP